jgi:hypothetical protein
MPNPVGLDAAGAPRENRHRSHAPQCDADSGFFSVHAPHIHVVPALGRFPLASAPFATPRAPPPPPPPLSSSSSSSSMTMTSSTGAARDRAAAASADSLLDRRRGAAAARG